MSYDTQPGVGRSPGDPDGRNDPYRGSNTVGPQIENPYMRPSIRSSSAPQRSAPLWTNSWFWIRMLAALFTPAAGIVWPMYWCLRLLTSPKGQRREYGIPLITLVVWQGALLLLALSLGSASTSASHGYGNLGTDTGPGATNGATGNEHRGAVGNGGATDNAGSSNGGTNAQPAMPSYDSRMNLWDESFPVSLAAQDQENFAPTPDMMASDQWRRHVNFWLMYACRMETVPSREIGVNAVLGSDLARDKLALFAPQPGNMSGYTCAVIDTPGVMTQTGANDYTYKGQIFTTNHVRSERSVDLRFLYHPGRAGLRSHIQIVDIK